MRIAIGLAGIPLIVISGLARILAPGPPSPGRLVCRNTAIVVGGPGTLGVDNHARFELRNEGGSPVTILEVQSSCGCTSAEVSKKIVGPGEVVTLDAVAQAVPVGHKEVPLTVATDSSATPIVAVKVVILGTQKPPFLHRVTGDLTYRGDFDRSETREVMVETIETGPAGVDPALKCDLPCLKFELTRRDQVKNGFLKDAVHRARFYRVTFASEPPSGSFSGRLRVSDPWTAGGVMDLAISGERQPEVQVSPARLTIDVDANGHWAKSARFLVRTRDAKSKLIVEPIGSQESPFEVAAMASVDGAGIRAYELRQVEGRSIGADVWEFKVGIDGSNDGVILRVQSRRAGE